LRGLRDRSLRAPLVAIGDRALGLWAALREVFPTTQHQRCWNHRVRNVQDKLPQRLKGEARPRLRATGQGSAADTVLRDWDAFVTFYRFPKDYWLHLRTTNPLESVFAGVRLRTDATTRMRTRERALALTACTKTRQSRRTKRQVIRAQPSRVKARWISARRS
jgi:putative transposase